jgi:hypothetical protein
MEHGKTSIKLFGGAVAALIIFQVTGLPTPGS